jgi:hypothetical protein
MTWEPLGIALERYVIEAKAGALRAWSMDATSQADGPLPVAVVVGVNPWQVKVTCPYGCRGGHLHGRGDPGSGQRADGPREPHCADRRARQYLVLTPAGIEDFNTTTSNPNQKGTTKHV